MSTQDTDKIVIFLENMTNEELTSFDKEVDKKAFGTATECVVEKKAYKKISALIGKEIDKRADSLLSDLCTKKLS